MTTILRSPLFRCAKPGGAGFYSGSRDAKHIDCSATGCRWNVGKSCAVPSLCKIKADGGCAGFEAKPLPKQKAGD